MQLVNAENLSKTYQTGEVSVHAIQQVNFLRWSIGQWKKHAAEYGRLSGSPQ
jgi:hypothetical protein